MHCAEICTESDRFSALENYRSITCSACPYPALMVRFIGLCLIALRYLKWA